MNEYNPELRGGGKSWAILGATILALEFREETLSNAFARARESDNKAIRAATALGTLAIVGHLMDIIPDKYDPLDRFANGIGKFKDLLADKLPLDIHIP